MKVNRYKHTLREPVISALKPINRPRKTDWHRGTTYISLFYVVGFLSLP